MRDRYRLFFLVLNKVREDKDILFALRYAQLSGYQKALKEKQEAIKIAENQTNLNVDFRG